ncbi:AraC family transcriptional regulator [Umezawaea endophytica]|uniref:AraC family transcriptional regulator n=1 Tax=Umezawaea endophytica TaxID=1654476 RepID=A0A9X3A443_9PSEU|nr:AraC family transcriptional regulator [Umezawaea endophytica]MCS7482459.1 AraC family transcriptional regulator [Umezawaea endophytica]
MDVLGEALANVRIGRAEACTVREAGSWGWRYPAFAGSGFHWVISGDAWLLTPDEPPRRLAPGDVVFTPAGGEHGLSHAPATLSALPRAVAKDHLPQPAQADVEFLCGAYWLDHHPVPSYLRSLPDVIAVSPDHDRHPHLRPLFDLVRANLVDTGPGAGVTRPALLDLVLTHLLKQWLADNRGEESPETTDPAMAEALRRIHAAPSHPWTVAELSAIVGLSRTAFVARFTTAVGRPPKRYLTGWRLSCAARLLRETDAPLASIARRVGYSTEFALSHAFRRQYGVPPGRFRALGRPSSDDLPVSAER